MERLAMAVLALAFAGCSGDKNGESTTQDDSTTVPDDSDSKTGGDGCAAPGRLHVRQRRLDHPRLRREGSRQYREAGGVGDSGVFLAHNWNEHGELGGEVKASVLYEDVDLEDGNPFPFEIDMCDGAFGEMWSEDNCGYNLLLLLDKNGNATPVNILPTSSSPRTRWRTSRSRARGTASASGPSARLQAREPLLRVRRLECPRLPVCRRDLQLGLLELPVS
jgi:hypothetical protein